MNKKIPTPLAILIILLVIAAIVGISLWLCPEKETVLPQEETTDWKICSVGSDCIVFGKDGDCNCGCFNKNYKDWQPGGACFCAAPTSCKCVDGKCEGVFGKDTTYIEIIQPKSSQTISSPFQIKGEIMISEQVMDQHAFVELIDENSHKLFPIMGRFENKSYFNVSQTKSPFSLDISYTQPTSQKGTIYIYAYTPTEGFEPTGGVLESWSPKTLIEIPIIFSEEPLIIPDDWNNYSNPEAEFIFQYPKDWEILSGYFYETPAGSKSEVMTVTLGKEEKVMISINLRQAMCSTPCWCREVKNNIIQTCSANLEILEIYNQILSTFRFIESETYNHAGEIIKIYQKDGKNYLDINFIKFLLFVDENGHPTTSPNYIYGENDEDGYCEPIADPYCIVDNTKTINSYEVAKDTVVIPANYPGNPLSYENLEGMIVNSPYFRFQIEDDIIKKISQIYIP